MPADPRYPLYTWDARLKRYRSKRTGRLVPASAVRRALDAALDNQQRRARDLFSQLASGRITPRAWQAGMRDIVKTTQLYSVALARGGWGQMTQRDYGIVGQAVREQYRFLNGFAADIRAGLPLDGRAQNRASMYVQAGRRTYHRVDRAVRIGRGDNEVRNVLHPADHCTGPGSCQEQADLGWQPITSRRITEPGDRLCLANCRCTLEYRFNPDVAAEADVGGPAVALAVGDDAEILARPAAYYAKLNPGEVETFNAYSTGGKWTRERQELHDAIIRKHFEGVTPVDDPVAFAMGGGPASGKSVAREGMDTGNMVIVDPDAIKEMLPEYQESADPNIATVVHEESSYLAKRVVELATTGKYRLLIDGTGDNAYESLAKKVASYRAAGARVIGRYVTVDTNEAVRRAEARRLGLIARGRVGRKVPETYLRSVHKTISQILPRAIEEGLFDELTLYDTNGPPGTSTLVLTMRDGKLTIHDQAAWDRFLAKANETVLVEEADVAAAAGTFTGDSASVIDDLTLGNGYFYRSQRGMGSLADVDASDPLGMAYQVVGLLPEADEHAPAISFDPTMRVLRGATRSSAKTIRLSPIVERELKNYLAGRRGGGEWNGIRTVIHEQLHIMSTKRPGEYVKKWGKELEEATVEALARRLADRAWVGPLPKDRYRAPSYDDWVSPLNEVERLTPGTIDKIFEADTTALRVRHVGSGTRRWIDLTVVPTLRQYGITEFEIAYLRAATKSDVAMAEFWRTHLMGVAGDVDAVSSRAAATRLYAYMTKVLPTPSPTAIAAAERQARQAPKTGKGIGTTFRVPPGVPLEGRLAKEQLDRTFKGQTLTDQERTALRMYQGPYQIINGPLRAGVDLNYSPDIVREIKKHTLYDPGQAWLEQMAGDVQKAVAGLDAAIARMPKTTRPMTVWRSTATQDWLKPEARRAGTVITDDGFLSTTTSRDQADRWRKHRLAGPRTGEFPALAGGTMIELRLPKGTAGLWTPVLSPESQAGVVVKQEFLLGRGLSWKIVDVRDDNGVLHLVLEPA